MERASATDSEEPSGRKRAALYVSPFLLLGLANVVLLLVWGLDPLWAFAIAPPILFLTAIGWVAFRHDFHRGPADGIEGREN